jgi:archaemetzincin
MNRRSLQRHLLFLAALCLAAACAEARGAGPSGSEAKTEKTEAPEPAQDDEKYGGTLALQPLGPVDKEAIETTAKSIKTYYQWRVKLLDGKDLPKEAWYKPRKRWRAEIILSWLAPQKPKWADRIMALTTKDISTTKGKIKDWGICGLADLDGPASVVSTLRIKRKLGKGTKKEKHEKYLRRLSDLTAHEFGHQLGLDHCPNKGCIMADAKGTVLTFDQSTSVLCEDCRQELIKRGWALP